MRLHCPCDDLAGLAFRKHTAQHKPSVLCQHTSIVESQLTVLTADANHAFGSIGSQNEAMACLNGQRVNKAVSATIIVSLEAFELTGLLTVGTSHRLTGCITRQSS